MPKDYLSQLPTETRRKDRAIADETWIAGFLHRAPFAALATVHDGQPFVNSNLFVFDEEARVLYLHTARVGRTAANVRAHERVCVSVSEMGRLLPAEEALEFSVEYAGVTVFGSAAIVDDPAEAERALQALLDKYFSHLTPGVDYRPITADELARTTVYRVAVESWSGKRKEAPADFPGAFSYADRPERSE